MSGRLQFAVVQYVTTNYYPTCNFFCSFHQNMNLVFLLLVSHDVPFFVVRHLQDHFSLSQKRAPELQSQSEAS